MVADPGRETETKVRLARIGFDNVLGFLPEIERVLAERPELASTANRLPASDFALWNGDEPSLQLVDVRNPAEQEAGVIAGTRPIPLAQLLDRVGELNPAHPTVVYCARGNRSSVAASVLRAKGFRLVADVLGGYEAWLTAGLPVTRIGTTNAHL